MRSLLFYSFVSFLLIIMSIIRADYPFIIVPLFTVLFISIARGINQNTLGILLIISFPVVSLLNKHLFGSYSSLSLYKLDDYHMRIGLLDTLLFAVSAYVTSFFQNSTSVNNSWTRGVNESRLLIFNIGALLVVLLLLFFSGAFVSVLSGNYKDVVALRNSREYQYFYAFVYWLLPMLCIVNMRLNPRGRVFWILLIFTVLVNLGLGRRTEPFGLVLMYFIINGSARFNFKSIAFAVLGVILFAYVGLIRQTGASSVSIGGEMLTVVKRTFDEISLTTQVIGAMHRSVYLGEITFHYGMDFLKGFLFMVPFAASFFPELAQGITSVSDSFLAAPNKLYTYLYEVDSINYEAWAQGDQITGLGFSVVAEFFLQFGVIGLVIGGVVWQILWKKLIFWASLINSKSFIGLFGLFYMLIWVRNDSVGLFRYMFYGFLFFLVIRWLRIVK